MKLGLIAMSGVRAMNPELLELGLTLPGFVERKEVIASLPSLGLLTLAGMTPNDIETCYIDLDDFREVDDLPGDFDAVAISSFSAQINAAYLLADQYRQLGTRVILGGLHVSALPQEALSHADSVLLGEGEVHWAELLNDLRHARLKPVYDARGASFNLDNAPSPRFDLLDPDKYDRLTVQTQRGCPFQCEFCASSILLCHKFKTKPVAKVVNEIREIKSIWRKPFIELADDNSFANKNHAKQLVRALAQLDIKWFTETDISVANDDELLRMLADSGCRQLLIGLESPNSDGLRNLELKTNWKEQQLDKYQEAIDRIQSYGISVNGCFILGLDGQDSSIFAETLEFTRRINLSEVQITIQTPFPGTPLYRRLKDSGRLPRAEFWNHCTLFDVNFVPRDMSIDELEQGFTRLMQDMYADTLVKTRKERFIRQAREKSKTSTASRATQ